MHQQDQSTFLLFQTDAHNYKIIGILKQLKFHRSDMFRFTHEPKHVGAIVGILIVLIFLWFYNCVHQFGIIKKCFDTETRSYSKLGLQSFLGLSTTYGITGTSVIQSSCSMHYKSQNYTKHQKPGYYSSILKKEFDTQCIQMQTMINILQNFSGHDKTKYKSPPQKY